MLTDSQKIDEVVRTLHVVIDHLETQQLTLNLIADQLQRPPSSELPDLLKALVAGVAAQSQRLDTLNGVLVRLPDEIARRVGR